MASLVRALSTITRKVCALRQLTATLTATLTGPGHSPVGAFCAPPNREPPPLSFDGILRRTRPAVSTSVSSAVSRLAHHDAMARLHSPSRDRPASAASRRRWRATVAWPRWTPDVHSLAVARALNRMVRGRAEQQRRISGAELSVEGRGSGISPTAPTASGMDLRGLRCNLGEHIPLPRVHAASETTLNWTTAAVIDRRNKSEPRPSTYQQWTPARIRER
jgi:hypothetical protein